MPTARCYALLVLLSTLGCGSHDPADGEGFVNDPAPAKAGLDNPPVAVGAFFDGVFPPRTPNAPGTSTWDVVTAFPALNLGDTLVIAPNPSNDRLYVGTRDGLIRSFDNQPGVASADTFLDLRDRTAVVWDGGFLGLIFHPEFGVPGSPNRNYFYVFYSSHCPLNGNRDAIDLGACDQGYPQGSTNGFFNTYLRLSRYEVPDGSTTADPNSERIMLNIRLYNGSHRGGGMVFRNDGYLHVTIGDQFHYDTAQDIVDTLEGGSMRFAVDITDNGDGTWSCPSGSHLPRRMFDTFDEISGQWYCIPDDNPWLDPGGGVFEEYCSIGHRNPHRLAWDPVTDYMWSGEIGESTREEINVIFCGNNYGWPFREGLIAGPSSEPSNLLGTLTDPVIDFVRSEARAIIGGYVYRGSKFAELYGRYLAGDYSTGNIWAITLDESTMTATKEFLTVFDPGGLGTWGQDNDGEVYLGDVIDGGPLYTLERVGQSVPDPPALLSATGAFSDMLNVVPDTAWVPYALNQPFWSDGADKARWIAVPNDGFRNTAAEQIAFSETTDWSFPIGTVLMKHFELPIDEADPSLTDRLETRFLVHGDDGEWYGLTYRWRPDETDADLLTGADSSLHTISLAGGGTRDQTWNYPSRIDCKACHRSLGVLGPRTHQLNGNFTYPSTGRTDNQLATWNHLGMFTPAIIAADIPTMIRSKTLSDVTASLQDRARSWLDSNCSNCHRPGEVVAGFDMRYTVPFEGQGLVWGPVRDDLGMMGTAVIVPGDPNLSAVYRRMEAVGPIAMPPLAKELSEQPAVDLMGEWILRIDPSIPQAGVNYEYWETAPLSALPDFDTLGTPDDVGTVSTFDIVVRNRDDNFAFRFRSFLEITTGGNYTFYTSSDDGSKLYIDGIEIVDNDGLHATTEQSGGPINLAPGYYAIEVTMFERTGGEALTVSWDGPDTGNNKQVISGGALFLQVPTPSPNDPPTLQTPPDQANSSGESVVLSLVGNDPDGDLLYFDAAGLPGGLSIDHLAGQITGTLDPSQPGGTYGVTASASDGPEVAVVSFNWVLGEPSCGNGTLEVGEECDDGNNTNGDGCASDCTNEVTQVCGDGVVTPPETCEPPGTDTCNDTCTARAPLCGDGFLTPPETCEDGNTADGDGCSSTCQVESAGQDLTDLGTVIARVTSPVGGGNHDLEVIRDGDFPPVGSFDDARQYDTWDGFNTSPDDWIGYSYTSVQTFGRVVFQEGKHFFDGGWFDSLTVQVRLGGVWNAVSGLSIVPSYSGGNGIAYETFEMTFDPATGDGIRIYGAPGGTADFVSVGELEVYEPAASTTCGDGVLEGAEECDDGNMSSGDGCSALCAAEFCGDGAVNNVTETCEPPGTDTCNDTCTARAPLCGDGFLTPPESCDDGNTSGGDGCSSICETEGAGLDLTDVGTIIARVPAPISGGNPDLETIRDNDKPPVGSVDDTRQFDTWDGSNTSPEDWIGYSYTSAQTFGKVVFQEGKHFFDGGWFDSLTVQVRQGGVWNDVTSLSTVPAYPGNNGITFETFEMTFAPVAGDGIRIHGAPGGSADFISVGELEVYEPAASTTCGDGVLEGAEECDDGNMSSGDGCSALCVAEFCGDGAVNNVTETCEPPNTAVCNSTCTARVPLCGDGFVTAPEQCDDGNTADGDGCDSNCNNEAPVVCGDGVVTPPETCEPPNTAVCNSTCTARVPLCGDGFLTPPESCDDGNTSGGDGCSSICETEGAGLDLTDVGTIIARVPAPIGGGNPDLETIRDDDKPPVGSVDDTRQFDTWDGSNTSPEDWIGYSYTSAQTFGKVVFQEGKHFFDGGWFDSLTVQVRQGGVWNDVTSLSTVPAYPGNNGITFETFEMTFAPVAGDGIRIHGAPGGSADFISIGELEVFAPGVVTCGNGALDAGEQCDDGNTTGGDGCGPTCLDEFCGDGIINNNGTETCEPPGTALCALDCTVRLPLCGDGFITPPETCEDGNTNDGDGCSSQCLLEGGDLTDVGTIIAAVPNPVSGGNPDSETIRDNDIPPVGTFDSLRQFDTWNGANVATEDWIGYAFPSQYSFNRVVFQEGMHFFDGGWFDTLTVQVRQGGTWVGVTGLLSTPTYAGNNGVTYEIYELTFDPAVGDAIRIFGAPGGSADFISVGELEVYGALP